jgi:hypothetical protein
MDLLKFEQLRMGNIYLIHVKHSTRRILFQYTGGTLNGACILPPMIVFDDSITEPPTDYYIMREAGILDFNASSNHYLAGYEDVSGTLLAEYCSKCVRNDYRELWVELVERNADFTPDYSHYNFIP